MSTSTTNIPETSKSYERIVEVEEDTESDTQPPPSLVCIKKPHIHKLGYPSLRVWVRKEGNIFIGKAGSKYLGKNSIFENPFQGEDSESSLTNYKRYLKNFYIEEIRALGGKTLGCWCTPDEMTTCHGQVIIQLFTEIKNMEKHDQANIA